MFTRIACRPLILIYSRKYSRYLSLSPLTSLHLPLLFALPPVAFCLISLPRFRCFYGVHFLCLLFHLVSLKLFHLIGLVHLSILLLLLLTFSSSLKLCFSPLSTFLTTGSVMFCTTFSKENQTLSWFFYRTGKVVVLVRQVVSAIRLGNTHLTHYRQTLIYCLRQLNRTPHFLLGKSYVHPTEQPFNPPN